VGVVRLNGVDPMRDREAALWDVGAVIENPVPYASETVFDALNRVGSLRGLDTAAIDRDIDRCVEELGLPDLGHRCGRLSKGQRQRVALAAARMGDPKVLLLDEPTDGMDPAGRRHVREMLRRLRDDHLILMSSHLMADVTEICDQLIFIDHGRILLRDSTDAIVGRTESPVLELEFAAPVEPTAFDPVRPWLEDVTRLSERRYRVRFDGRPETRLRILEASLRIGPIRSFTGAYPALESAYLEVIGAGSRS
jgi:ABC-2 type transport system ATP-binding protein